MARLLSYFIVLLCCIKASIAWIMVAFIGNKLREKEIWLFEEKRTEARDNAYHLYIYIKKHHPEINAFYVIKKGTADEKKINDYKTSIPADTIKHYLYWMVSKYSISSQPYGAAPNPREWIQSHLKLCRKDQKVVFLQHGIIINKLPGLDYLLTGFDLFTCSAIPEYAYIHQGLHYPEGKVQLVGMCRFDNLNSFDMHKIVLIMPTFRRWLASAHTDKDATEDEMKHFIESNYYYRYSELLNNDKLQQEAKENGYRIIFYMHYALQSYTRAFAAYNNQIVMIADREKYDVQQLLKDSAVLVTDYSSVFFDFAYMEKPEVFYQFDEEQFRGEHYQQGYFDYRRDGFGPVFTDSDELVDYLIVLMKNGCTNKPEYIKRIQSFFPYRDSENCVRTYNAIIKIS